MSVMTLEKLHQRMRKVEALYLGATTPGERAAAAHSLERLRARIAELRASNGSIASGRHAKWRRPRQTRSARGRWEKSSDANANEQPDGSARVTFRLSDRWAKYLLLALARRYGLKASRNRRWPELTIVLSGPEDVLDDLALQFEIFSQELVNELEQATRRIIVEKVGQMQDYTWLRWGRF